MRGFGVLLRKELREQWRTLKTPIIGLVFLVIGIGSPLLARYTPELLEQFAGDIQVTLPPPTVRDALAQLTENAGLVGLLTAILIGMGAVAREKETGTAALTLSKPVTRLAFLTAKWVALSATLAVGVLLAGVAAYVYTTLLFEAPPVAGFTAFVGLLLLTYVVYLSFTLLGSALTRSALAAAGIGFALYIVTSVVGALPNIGRFMPGALAGPGMAIGMGETAESVVWPVLFNLALVALLIWAAWFSFRRQAL